MSKPFSFRQFREYVTQAEVVRMHTGKNLVFFGYSPTKESHFRIQLTYKFPQADETLKETWLNQLDLPYVDPNNQLTNLDSDFFELHNVGKKQVVKFLKQQLMPIHHMQRLPFPLIYCDLRVKNPAFSAYARPEHETGLLKVVTTDRNKETHVTRVYMCDFFK